MACTEVCPYILVLNMHVHSQTLGIKKNKKQKKTLDLFME